jgi:beta-lactam-binding protein with PASTA domain
VPYVLFDPAPIARTDIIAAKLVPNFKGANPTKNSWVNTQSPEAGTVVAQGTTVTMVLLTGPTP